MSAHWKGRMGCGSGPRDVHLVQLTQRSERSDERSAGEPAAVVRAVVGQSTGSTAVRQSVGKCVNVAKAAIERELAR